MKIFISWSGETSKAIATAFSEWIPKVIQVAKPWISSENIDKGERWNHQLASELESAKVGIICVTPDNQSAPWLLFEAGALSKTIDNTRVCPVLFNINTSDLTGPLTQFQLTLLNKIEIKKLMITINKSFGEYSIHEKLLNDSFEKWWPDFEERISAIPEKLSLSPKIERPDNEIIAEILDIVRKLNRMMSNPHKNVRTFSSHSMPSLDQYIKLNQVAEYLIEELLKLDSFNSSTVSVMVTNYANKEQLSEIDRSYLFTETMNELTARGYF